MQDISYYENLLDKNQPAKAAKMLSKYDGKNGLYYFTLAEARRMSGDFEPAISLYNKAINLYKNQQHEPDYKETIIDMNLALAKCYRTLGNAQKAQELAAMALHAAQVAKLEDFLVQAKQEFAMAQRARGQLAAAAKTLGGVMAYYKKQSDYAGIAFIYWALGGISRLKGDFKSGVAQFKQSIIFAKKAKDKPAQAYGYCGLAGISRIAGDIAGCVHNYTLAEQIFKNTDDTFGKAYTNCGMANGLRQLGDYKTAMEHYSVAGKLYAGINDRVDLGFVKWGRADILKRQNKLTAALKELLSAKKLFAGSDEIRGQLLTEFSLAQLTYALGQRGEAVKIYNTALKRARSEGLHTYLEIYT